MSEQNQNSNHVSISLQLQFSPKTQTFGAGQAREKENGIMYLSHFHFLTFFIPLLQGDLWGLIKNERKLKLRLTLATVIFCSPL